MQVYRCGNCQRELIGGAVFCAHCDSFFDLPVPEGCPASESTCRLTPSMVPIMESRRVARGIVKFLCGSLAVCVLIAGLTHPGGRNGRTEAAQDLPTIHDALEADLAADSAETYNSRRYATDLMLSMSTQCRIQHSSYSRNPGDQVLMIADSSLTTRQARSRMLFAAFLLRDLRCEYYSQKHEQTVRILLMDKSGERMKTTVAPGRCVTDGPHISVQSLKA